MLQTSLSQICKIFHIISQELHVLNERRLAITMISSNNCTCNDNYVYLNKIFFSESENSSPIMTPFDSTTAEFTQQLTVGTNICGQQIRRMGDCGCGCGCNSGDNTRDRGRDRGDNCSCDRGIERGGNCGCDCCCDLTITADTTFNISNAYVIVRSFTLTDPTTITPEDVTVEGLPITALTPNGNQFVGDISGIMAEITRCACQPPCASGCPGNYVMITAPGPWELIATIVVEGTVYTNGPSCQFRICYNTSPTTPLEVTGPASFAFCGVRIPCQISGISPTLVFDFNACAKLLNPTITVTCTDGVCTPVLSGSLVVTPEANLQVTRPSIFNLGDYEVELPCDDLGQCDPCNATEAQCIEPNIACQCCDTNGYSF